MKKKKEEINFLNLNKMLKSKFNYNQQSNFIIKTLFQNILIKLNFMVILSH